MQNMLLEKSKEIAQGKKKKKEAETKQNQYPVVDVTGDGGKVRCCKNNIA